jgi:hypothetical protein
MSSPPYPPNSILKKRLPLCGLATFLVATFLAGVLLFLGAGLALTLVERFVVFFFLIAMFTSAFDIESPVLRIFILEKLELGHY